jgi:CHASE1-domain containing sensor protein
VRRLNPILILIALALETLALAGLVIRDGIRDPVWRQSQRDNAQLVETLMLTDLALWTEARYTRHPSQADGFTAFQNGPAALDHLPAGTWVPPVRHGQTTRAPSANNK